MISAICYVVVNVLAVLQNAPKKIAHAPLAPTGGRRAAT
jgi:hypothetical protein